MNWIEKAKATHKYHIDKKKINPHWTIKDTCKELRRSLGSVCEDLLIVSWLKTHSRELEQFKYAKDAIAFIRDKKEQMQFDE